MRRPHAPARWAPLSLSLLGIAQLVGCAAEPHSGAAWIAPFHGQTAVSTELPLIVQVPNLSVPPDYPAPDRLIRVVDLGPSSSPSADNEGQVLGSVELYSDALHFVPDSPWLEQRRYAWVITPVGDLPHSVELGIPSALRGTAIFDTSVDRLDVLAGTALSETEACFVVSRPLGSTALDTLRLTLRYDVLTEYSHLEEFTVFELSKEQWSEGIERDERDEGASVFCAELHGTSAPSSELPSTFREGAVVRLWFGEQGPWRVTLGAAPVTSTVRSLHRWTEEAE